VVLDKLMNHFLFVRSKKFTSLELNFLGSMVILILWPLFFLLSL